MQLHCPPGLTRRPEPLSWVASRFEGSSARACSTRSCAGSRLPHQTPFCCDVPGERVSIVTATPNGIATSRPLERSAPTSSVRPALSPGTRRMSFRHQNVTGPLGVVPRPRAPACRISRRLLVHHPVLSLYSFRIRMLREPHGFCDPDWTTEECDLITEST